MHITLLQVDSWPNPVTGRFGSFGCVRGPMGGTENKVPGKKGIGNARQTLHAGVVWHQDAHPHVPFGCGRSGGMERKGRSRKGNARQSLLVCLV